MNEDDLKRQFVERQMRLFFNILRQLKDEELIIQFNSRYNEIVYKDAKKAYIKYKTRQSKRVNHFDDLFSNEV